MPNRAMSEGGLTGLGLLDLVNRMWDSSMVQIIRASGWEILVPPDKRLIGSLNQFLRHYATALVESDTRIQSAYLSVSLDNGERLERWKEILQTPIEKGDEIYLPYSFLNEGEPDGPEEGAVARLKVAKNYEACLRLGLLKEANGTYKPIGRRALNRALQRFMLAKGELLKVEYESSRSGISGDAHDGEAELKEAIELRPIDLLKKKVESAPLQLRGASLVDFAIANHNDAVPETSICIRAGFSTDSIGSFRRAFARASGATFAPLDRMIMEISSTRARYEQSGSSDLFINREKKTASQTRSVRSNSFRGSILAKHGSKCICCGISHPKLIEAAHIIPVDLNGSDNPRNGVPLCATHHKAFDSYLIAFDPDSMEIVVSADVNRDEIGAGLTFLPIDVDVEALRARLHLFYKKQLSGI